MNKKYGYARVSTKEQRLDLQLDALTQYGCDEIFTDHGISGAKEQREGLEQVLNLMSEGDELVVYKLDRLARNLRYLIKIVEEFKEKGCHLVSLSESINTNSAMGGLIFHIFGAIAEFERELIKERVMAGLEAARRRGVRSGPKRRMTREKWTMVQTLIKNGSTVDEICACVQIGRTTFYRYLELWGN